MSETREYPESREDGRNIGALERERAVPDRSMPALLKELFRESQALARAEAALIKGEMSEKVSEAQKGFAAMVGGGATLAAGLLVLLAAAVFALDYVLALWLSALLVGAVVTVIGAMMLAAGKRKVSAEHLRPERTLEEARRTKAIFRRR